MAKAKPTPKPEQEVIDLAIKRLKRCVEADKENRSAAIDDLKFANGDQWDPGEKKRRGDKGRPALQINLLPKFIDQVVGDMLHNSPSIKVRPVDSRADINIAKIRQGIISNIEYLSNSSAIYGYAARQQVTSGYGSWRVLTRYTDENPFLQEAYLESIRNPFLVYMDPDSKDQNYADARYGFILEKVPVDDFEEKYPKATKPASEFNTGSGMGDEHWYDGDTITVAEYFTAEKEKATFFQLKDGRVVDAAEYKDLLADWEERNGIVTQELISQGMQADQGVQGQPPMQGGIPMPPQDAGAIPQGVPPMALPQGGQPQQAPPPEQPQQVQPPTLLQKIETIGEKPEIAKTRETEQTIIRHRILTCCEILEGGNDGKKFPGSLIPIVLLKGKELNIEGKNVVYSLIRHAKDPQKMVNYWNTSAAETIALAPKAPWLGTAKQFDGYENDYAAANVENFPMLKYNIDPEALGPPQRQQPSQPPVAMFEQIRRGEDNLKSVIGLFNADVGAPGSEQTGAAITARQRPGDIGTYEFSVNLSRAVLFTGRILNGIIPEIYDTERDVRLRNVDETETFVPVNTTVGNAAKSIEKRPEVYRGMNIDKIYELVSKEGRDAKFNDITVGKYDVVVTTGPSYATQRQEAAQHLLQLSQSMPQQMALAADLIVENLDFKGADELAERLRKSLPPGMAKLRPGEQPLPAPGPSPQEQLLQAKAQSEQAKVQLAQMKVEQEKIKLEMEKVKLEMEKLTLQKEQQGDGPDPIDQQDRDRKFVIEEERIKLENARLQHQQRMDVARHHQSAQESGAKRKFDSDKMKYQMLHDAAKLENTGVQSQI